MQTVTDLATLRAVSAALRQSGKTLGLVPTMGALHAGHLALVEQARRTCDHVAASIFVNPTQFAAHEDLDAYPRSEQEDAAKLAALGVDLLWLPDAATMYPDGHVTRIGVSGVSSGLCGDVRPGHFDGVATVVAKLFNQVAPTHAFFGEKDYQQLAVIRRMARDLDFDISITGVPTVRDADGLALSSRNAYLSAEQRAQASALPATLRWLCAALLAGENAAQALEKAGERLLAAGFHRIDYLELRDGDSLTETAAIAGSTRIFVAAHIGRTRLIDNVALSAPPPAAATM